MSTTELPPQEVPKSDEVTQYLVVDIESVPDGKLVNAVKYPGQGLNDEEAVRQAQEEARAHSLSGSDFLPPSFQIPVSVCTLRVKADFTVQSISCLDAPQFRPQKIVEDFWRGLVHYRNKSGGQLKLVTFNGRGFDLPLLELSAFRYGCSAPDYFKMGRNRYTGYGFDLMEWLTNYGALRQTGVKLDIFAKLLGKPGKCGTAGDQVYEMYRQGKIQEINDYCMCDTLDTYFVFLRTRVLEGQITLAREQELVALAKEWLSGRSTEVPALAKYLENWGDWTPWP
jgi:predicted PolB exonuclease-like 3'-5' exonuclease